MTASTILQASLLPDAYGYNSPANQGGALRALIGQALVPASSEAGTIITLPGQISKLPWAGILVPGMAVVAREALGTSVTVAIGLYNGGVVRGGVLTPGTLVSANCLLAAADWAAAGSGSLLATLALHPAATAWGKPLWVTAGLSADPGGFADLSFTTAGATTTASDKRIGFVLPYIEPAGN